MMTWDKDKVKITTNIDSLQIWDNIIDDRFLLDFDEESNVYPWNLNNTANRKSYPYGNKGSHVFWGHRFNNDNCPDYILGLSKFLLEEVIQKPYKISTIDFNAQSMGQDGTCHLDNSFGTGERSLMVFFTYKWKEEWGGDFQLLEAYDNDSKVVKSIKYIPGRVVFFDGNIPHRGLAPLEPYVMRKSLVFRLSPIN